MVYANPFIVGGGQIVAVTTGEEPVILVSTVEELCRERRTLKSPGDLVPLGELHHPIIGTYVFTIVV